MEIGTRRNSNSKYGLIFGIAGIAQGVLPLIGYNYAVRNFRRMKLSIAMIFGAAFIFSFCSMVLAYHYPKTFISFFTKDQETVMYGVRFIKILCLCVPLTVISYTGVTVYQAIGKKNPGYTCGCAAQRCCRYSNDDFLVKDSTAGGYCLGNANG